MKKLPDVRVIFLLSLCFSMMGVLFRSAIILSVLLALSVISALLMKVDVFRTIKRLRSLISVIIFVSLMQSIFNQNGTVLFELFHIKILTTGGILIGVSVLLRMGILIVLGSNISVYSRRDCIQGLIQVGIPYRLAFMVSIAIRFIPIFSEEFSESLTAIQLRGIDMKKGGLKIKLKIYAYLIMPVVIKAILRAQDIALAMEMRGFGALDERSSFNKLHLSAFDYVLMVLIVAITSLISIFYYI